jgi:hypothetical protein
VYSGSFVLASADSTFYFIQSLNIPSYQMVTLIKITWMNLKKIPKPGIALGLLVLHSQCSLKKNPNFLQNLKSENITLKDNFR